MDKNNSKCVTGHFATCSQCIGCDKSTIKLNVRNICLACGYAEICGEPWDRKHDTKESPILACKNYMPKNH